MQRKELSKKDEPSMDVEVNLLQQKFNKIELEIVKKRGFRIRNMKKSIKRGGLSLKKRSETGKEIQNAFDKWISPYKVFKNPI